MNTEGKAIYVVPIVLLVALGAYLVWRAVVGSAGAGAGQITAVPGSGSGGGWVDKLKAAFVPTSIDPRKGSVGNPAGYVYGPTVSGMKSVTNFVKDLF